VDALDVGQVGGTVGREGALGMETGVGPLGRLAWQLRKWEQEDEGNTRRNKHGGK